MEGLFANTMMARAEGDTILSLPTSRVVRIDGILARDVPEGGAPDVVGTTPIQGFRGGRALLNPGVSRIETQCERNGQSWFSSFFPRIQTGNWTTKGRHIAESVIRIKIDFEA